jgi:hypothetical protein
VVREGRMQTERQLANAGSRLKRRAYRKASETPAFQPYWGKPAVRNDRGDGGNVGIIRSPVRATVLPDIFQRVAENPTWARPGFMANSSCWAWRCQSEPFPAG